MKTISRIKYPLLAAIVFILSFSLNAYAAESPRDELVHTYRLLKSANADYNGHRAKAIAEVQAAGRDLGLELEGDLPRIQEQWKSDAKLREARKLLRDAHNKLESHDHPRAGEHLDHAIIEIDESLMVR